MDDAFCGGGDTNEGLTSTAIPIQASAVNMIKVAIFMGDPRYIPAYRMMLELVKLTE